MSTSPVFTPPLGAGDKRIFVTLLLTAAVTLMGLGVVVPLMPVFAKDLGASGLWLGMMLAAFSLSRGLLQPFVGVLSDRHGRKRFIVAGLAIYAAISFVYIVARSPLDLTLMRLVHGAGSAMVLPVIIAYLGDMTPPNKEGQYMAYLNIAIFGGLGAGPLLGGLLNDTAGIAAAFSLMGGLSAVALLLIIWLLPPGKALLPGESRASFAHLRETFRSARIRGLLGYQLFTAVAVGPTYAFLPVFMNDSLNASGSVVGLVYTVRVGANAICQLPFGYLADRMNRVLLATVGAAGTGLFVLLIPSADSVGMLIGLIAVMGTFEGLTWATVLAMSVHEGRRHGQGSVQGLSQMAMSMGLLAGALLGGAVTDLFGIDSAFVVAGILIGVGGFLSAGIYLQGNRPGVARYEEAGVARQEETISR